MDSMHTDCESILVQLKHQQKELKFKRRWLMGLPMSHSDQKQLKEFNFQKDRTIPESLLREDDVYYETIKTFVENGFGTSSAKREHRMVHRSMQPFDLPNDERNIISLLDDMTNKGLYLFAEVLTGDSIKLEKTRSRMKRIIREHLPRVLRNQNDKHWINICKQICQLLKDPCNFGRNCVTPASKSCHAAATKVLDGLGDFSFQTLSAMHRKLKGIQGYMPQLQPPRSRSEQRRLIDKVRKRCMREMSKPGEEDELQEPLAKAMTVAGLSLRLKQGWSSETEFQQFPPEIEALQDEIVKTIWLLKRKVTVPELKNLQILLDPIAKLPHRGLRKALRELLTEYLFECSDIDMIPECLLEALSTTNRSSRSVPYRICLKKEIEEEVECVLSVSAQMKQIVWDLLPEHKFDQGYIDAYMGDLEETDDGDHDDGYDDFDDNEEKQVELLENSMFCYSHDLIEGTGETVPTNLKLPSSTTKGNDTSQVTPLERNSVERQEPTIDLANQSQFVSSDLTNGEANIMHDNHRNQYLAIQEACDKTSMVAYRLVGCILDEFAQIEGINLDRSHVSYLRSNGSIANDSQVTKQEEISYEGAHGSTITEVLEELFPSFP